MTGAKKHIVCEIVLLLKLTKLNQGEMFRKLMKRRKLYLQGYYDGLKKGRSMTRVYQK
ncbi:hypothetical protein LCGC14_0753020 [marine sediment metagenome]|uniref:Uncharacterized protein n=1 Tax=marine sediment metagenome TaxID=412755 RepID=A0A0F9TAI3_9ZZZZ